MALPKMAYLFITESFPNALEEFYGGVSGSLYTCEGEFEYDPGAKIQVAVISGQEVAVKEADSIQNCYTRILEYERQGSLRINRFESLTGAQRESEHKMILSAIKRYDLLQGNHPMAPFAKEKFPGIWVEARRMFP